jgi:hypothetical protein
MGIFTSGRKNDKDPKKRLKAVLKLKDQAILLEIALSDDDPDIAATAVERVVSCADHRRIALEARTDNARRRALDFVNDQATICAVILNTKMGSKAAEKALTMPVDENGLCDAAIALLTREERLKRKINASKDWCVERLVKPLPTDDVLARLACSFDRFTQDDWFMVYFLRALRQEREALLPEIAVAHPDDLYASRLLAEIENEASFDRMLHAVAEPSRRSLILDRIGRFPNHSELRKRFCGESEETPHRFGDGLTCACCGKTRDNPGRIVTGKENTYAFARFRTMLVRIDGTHTLHFKFNKYLQDVAETHVRNDITAVAATQRKLLESDGDAYRIFASADETYLALLSCAGKVSLLPTDGPGSAGFYDNFFGKHMKSAYFENIKDWSDVIGVAGNDHRLAGLRRDGRIMCSPSVQDFPFCGAGLKDVVRIAMTQSFGKKDIFGALTWDGRISVDAADESAKDTIEGWRDIVSIAAAHNDFLAITKTGDVLLLRAVHSGTGLQAGTTYVEKRLWSDMGDIIGVAAGSFARPIVGLRKNGALVTEEGVSLGFEDVVELQGGVALQKNGNLIEVAGPDAREQNHYVLDALPSLQ